MSSSNFITFAHNFQESKFYIFYGIEVQGISAAKFIGHRQ